MKKFLSLVIVLAVVLTGVSAAAETPTWEEWLTSLDTDTVRQLAILFQTEYLSRTGMEKGFDVPAGVYHVGTDFPTGTFTFEMIAEGTEVIVYKDADTYYDEYGFPFFDQIMHSMNNVIKIGSLYLSYGNILVIEGRATAKPFLGLGF